jgi:hypothetical protein
MSLTSRIANRSDPVSRFLTDLWPPKRRLPEEWMEALAQANTLRPPEPVDWGRVGRAFDYRFRFMLAEMPSRSLVAWKGAFRAAFTFESPALDFDAVEEVFTAIDDQIRQLAPAGRNLDPTAERSLAATCIVLGLFEEVYRGGPTKEAPIFQCGPQPTLADLHELAKPAWLDDLVALANLAWRAWQGRGSWTYYLNPTFAGSHAIGGADADLIAYSNGAGGAGTLLEIKTTTRSRLEPDWLRQLLGYLLLDWPDEYCIRHLGFYLARQGLLLSAPVSAFLPTPSNDLATWRDRFKSLLDGKT